MVCGLVLAFLFLTHIYTWIYKDISVRYQMLSSIVQVLPPVEKVGSQQHDLSHGGSMPLNDEGSLVHVVTFFSTC